MLKPGEFVTTLSVVWAAFEADVVQKRLLEIAARAELDIAAALPRARAPARARCREASICRTPTPAALPTCLKRSSGSAGKQPDGDARCRRRYRSRRRRR